MSLEMIYEQIKILFLVLATVFMLTLPIYDFNITFVSGLLIFLAYTKAKNIAEGKFKKEDLQIL